ncbi:MAG: hypothetical protein QOE13_748 [Gaiellaceae bacterium]|jgi:hypothetical protein|nr:hypothetical protein [Gaiellaceae bacterium]
MFRTWLDPPIPNDCSPAVVAVQEGEDLRKAQIIVTALDQTIADLRARGASGWQEHIETLDRLREETVAEVHNLDPSVSFDRPMT